MSMSMYVIICDYCVKIIVSLINAGDKHFCFLHIHKCMVGVDNWCDKINIKYSQEKMVSMYRYVLIDILHREMDGKFLEGNQDALIRKLHNSHETYMGYVSDSHPGKTKMFPLCLNVIIYCRYLFTKKEVYLCILSVIWLS